MRRLLALVTLALALVVACQFPACQKGPLVVDPNSAQPGTLIHLHQDRGAFQSYGSLRVAVGGQPAHVSRVISNTDIDVVVPMQPPATVEVHVSDGDHIIALATFSVLDTNCRRFVMSMEANHVKLLRVEPCFDNVDGDVATLNPRLSFDLVDNAGHVLHTVSIPHPLETPTEVFSRSGKEATIGRTSAPSHAVFWIRMPNLPNAHTIRVYRVAAGLDLKDPQNLGSRTFVDSLGVSVQ